DQFRGVDAGAGVDHAQRIAVAVPITSCETTVGYVFPGPVRSKREGTSRSKVMKLRRQAVAASIALMGCSAAWAAMPEAQKWVDAEFQPSSLSKDQQLAEMQWFIEAAAKLKAKGVNEVNVVSETITTHEYESKTLARAFTEITGI